MAAHTWQSCESKKETEMVVANVWSAVLHAPWELVQLLVVPGHGGAFKSHELISSKSVVQNVIARIL